MKSAFIRMMAVALFAMPVSAFAMSSNAKTVEDKNSSSANFETAGEVNVALTLNELMGKVDLLQGQVQQLEIRDKENQKEQEARQDDTNKKIRQEEKEWEYSLKGN
jgi:TolA-binding protein